MGSSFYEVYPKSSTAFEKACFSRKRRLVSHSLGRLPLRERKIVELLGTVLERAKNTLYGNP